MGRNTLVQIEVPDFCGDAFTMWLYWRMIESNIRIRIAEKTEEGFKIVIDTNKMRKEDNERS